MVATSSSPVVLDLMTKLAAMKPASLEAVHRFVLQLEIAQLGEEIEDDFESLRQEGQLAPELIEAAIREHRKDHPYPGR
jgi:hypothetical protein